MHHPRQDGFWPSAKIAACHHLLCLDFRLTGPVSAFFEILLHPASEGLTNSLSFAICLVIFTLCLFGVLFSVPYCPLSPFMYTLPTILGGADSRPAPL